MMGEREANPEEVGQRLSAASIPTPATPETGTTQATRGCVYVCVCTGFAHSHSEPKELSWTQP